MRVTITDKEASTGGTSRLRAIWSDWVGGVFHPATLAVWVVASAGATLMGPFGTYEGMSALGLVRYWPPVIALSIFVAYLGRGIATHLLAGISVPLRELCSGAFLTAVFAPMIWVLNTSVYGVAEGAITFLEIASSVMLVSLGVSLIRFALGLEVLDAPGDAPVVAEDIPRFAARLDGWSGSPIIHLTVDDHYTEAHCLDGSMYRVLIRFADAVNEMEGANGVCIHRSHWVILDHIAETLRKKGRDFVRLSTGAVLPVSRKYRINLVETGYLAAPAKPDAA